MEKSLDYYRSKYYFLMNEEEWKTKDGRRKALFEATSALDYHEHLKTNSKLGLPKEIVEQARKVTSYQ